MKAARQPLLWAALAYAAGTTLSGCFWRPAALWIAAVCVFLAAAAFWTKKRPVRAQVSALLALASVAFVAAQIRTVPPPAGQLPDEDSEVVISAHVIAEGEPMPTRRGGVRQSLEVLTESIDSGAGSKAKATGLRVNVFDSASTAAFSTLHYGDRLRFPAHLHSPRNYHNPGAFDYVGYLAAKGISATASVRVGMRNPFGLPKRDVLQRLQDSRVITYRTDTSGATTFLMDGTSVMPQ